ncbi:MAG: RNA-binding S4 domain-containing protein [Peptococcaceae bacterium]|nr:RNA-binding S4 domain-containing protein [Peptococcaceae bacterium]
MRVDKFLKVSRIIKRRTVAKEVCDGGKVKINGRVAKAGSEVAVGDELEIQFGEKRFHARIKEVRETVPAKEADSLYEVLS